jgi:hypothetical protein
VVLATSRAFTQQPTSPAVSNSHKPGAPAPTPTVSSALTNARSSHARSVEMQRTVRAARLGVHDPRLVDFLDAWDVAVADAAFETKP